MPRTSKYDHYFHDLQYAYEELQGLLAPRGMYAEVSLLLVANPRRPGELRDVSLEFVVRSRSRESIVWRASESLRVPGRSKMRSIASVLFGMMMRAAIDIEGGPPLPGDDRSQRGVRART
jgi:hypothetical protein